MFCLKKSVSGKENLERKAREKKYLIIHEDFLFLDSQINFRAGKTVSKTLKQDYLRGTELKGQGDRPHS